MKLEISKLESLLVLKALSSLMKDADGNPIDKAAADRLAEKIRSQVLFDYVVLNKK